MKVKQCVVSLILLSRCTEPYKTLVSYKPNKLDLHIFFSSLSQPVVRKTSDKQNRKSADNGVIPYPEPKGNELLDNGPNQTHLSRPLKETGSNDSIYTSYQIISINKMLMDRTR